MAPFIFRSIPCCHNDPGDPIMLDQYLPWYLPAGGWLHPAAFIVEVNISGYQRCSWVPMTCITKPTWRTIHAITRSLVSEMRWSATGKQEKSRRRCKEMSFSSSISGIASHGVIGYQTCHPRFVTWDGISRSDHQWIICMGCWELGSCDNPFVYLLQGKDHIQEPISWPCFRVVLDRHSRDCALPHNCLEQYSGQPFVDERY